MSLLGARLKELRGSASLYEAANEIGIPRGQLHRYENGQMPSFSILKELANFYETPYEELRRLQLEDTYTDSEERRIVQAWALNSLGFPEDFKTLVAELERLPQAEREKLLAEALKLFNKKWRVSPPNP